MKMQLTTTQFEDCCNTLCGLLPPMGIEQARACLSDVFYRCDYATAQATRLQQPFATSSETVQSFVQAMQGRTLLLCTKSSAVLFQGGHIQVPQATPAVWEIKAFAKRMKKYVGEMKHSHILSLLTKIVMGADYHSVEFPSERSHPANVFAEKCKAAGIDVKPFFVPSFYGNVWADAEIEQLVLSAQRMGATDERNIFSAIVDASRVTINGKDGFPAFSTQQFRDSDVIKSKEPDPAGALSECLFVWSPEHADGTVYDVEFHDLCEAHHLDGRRYRVRSATGWIDIEIHP